mmetsp:Transcript_29031/g.49491  ORF Transcript_29031/g.49491 Transcript_29031/m.49491 type:complete len:279 (-) Transcript_29031:326-1162(-)
MASISSSIFLLTAADKPILIRNGPRFFGTGGSSFGGLLAASSPSSISPSSSSSSSSSLPLLLSGSFASSSSSSNNVASPLASSPLFTSTCDGISTGTFSAFVLTTAAAGPATAAAASAAEEGPANETLEHVDPLLELALSSFSFSAIFLDGDGTAAAVVVAPIVIESSIFFFSSLPCDGGTDSASFSGKEDDIMGTSASLVTIGFNCPCAMKFSGTVVLLVSSTAAGVGANVDIARVGAVVVSSRISPSSSELASSFSSSFSSSAAAAVLASGALRCC